MQLTTMTYAVTGKIARITLDRPERSNALTFETPRELAECVERANLDPAVQVIALAGAGAGFCGGYDLRIGAEYMMRFGAEYTSYPKGSPYDPEVFARNHVPARTWDPTICCREGSGDLVIDCLHEAEGAGRGPMAAECQHRGDGHYLEGNRAIWRGGANVLARCSQVAMMTTP